VKKYLLKEMMWLGADFQAERKRQVALAKKCATSVSQFHKTKETRRLREIVQADVRRRKLAAKIGREVRTWWNKLDKVIAFKQKTQADEERNRAMNRQLVFLVQQTERYTHTLEAHTFEDTTTDNDESECGSQSTRDESIEKQQQALEYEIQGWDDERRTKNTPKRYRNMTIEEALASENRRQSKSRVVDYARMKLETKEFYGESTASDAPESDSSFSLHNESDEADDDSTLRAAMEEEIRERIKWKKSTTVSKHIFSPDPEEIRKLHEEQSMDIHEAIQRLIDEPYSTQEITSPSMKSVKFSDSVPKISAVFQRPKVDHGMDVDDDEDFSGTNDANSDVEYEVDKMEVDDQTTVTQVENLPKETAYSGEIDLLKNAAMPIDTRSDYARKCTQQAGKPTSTSEEENRTKKRGTEDLTDEKEYLPGGPEMDDETTMAQEEKMPRDVSYSEELDLLKQGAEIPIEELRKMYADLPAESADEEGDKACSSSSDEVLDEEFEDFAVPAVDDETTMEAEESLGRDMTYEEEIEMLNRENEMSISELRAMYLGLDDNSSTNSDSCVEVKKSHCRSSSRKRESESNSLSVEKSEPQRSRGEIRFGSDDIVADLSVSKAFAGKERQTLASRPFLLAPWVKLRLYQQVGLDWLVSLQTRRLNGILADEVSGARVGGSSFNCYQSHRKLNQSCADGIGT
jgi:hypothetical protein